MITGLERIVEFSLRMFVMMALIMMVVSKSKLLEEVFTFTI